MKFEVYLNEAITKPIMDEYFGVKQANELKVLDEQTRKRQVDQFEPSRTDLAGLVVARDKDGLVGGIKLFKRTCVYDDQEYQLGGFGGVFTANQYKRQGVATMMLAKSMLALEYLHVDVAYLCTDISKLDKLYRPFGFRHLTQGHTYLGKSGKRYTEYDGMLAMVSSWEIFSQLMLSDTPIDIGVGNW